MAVATANKAIDTKMNNGSRGMSIEYRASTSRYAAKATATATTMNRGTRIFTLAPRALRAPGPRRAATGS